MGMIISGLLGPFALFAAGVVTAIAADKLKGAAKDKDDDNDPHNPDIKKARKYNVWSAVTGICLGLLLGLLFILPFVGEMIGTLISLPGLVGIGVLSAMSASKLKDAAKGSDDTTSDPHQANIQTARKLDIWNAVGCFFMAVIMVILMVL